MADAAVTHTEKPIVTYPTGSKTLTQPNSETRYEVRKRDLPLHCPMKGTRLWDSHPRVFIPLTDENREERCPYCGALYVLKD
jgi:uncharacterized Zn-finger protein